MKTDFHIVRSLMKAVLHWTAQGDGWWKVMSQQGCNASEVAVEGCYELE